MGVIRRQLDTLVDSETGNFVGFVDGDGTIRYVPGLDVAPPAGAQAAMMNPTGTALVDPASGVDFAIGGSIAGMSPSATASVNATALQAALNTKGRHSITTPGEYLIGDGTEATEYASIYVDSDTSLYLGAGVILKQTVSAKSLFINKNWKSNAVAITAVVHTYDTPTSGTSTMEVNTGTVSAGLAVGEYAYIKNDTANAINGVFKVISIDESDTNNRKFTVRRNGARGTTMEFSAYAGSPIVYKANANIVFEGDGLIDYQFKGTSGTKAMGTVMNKVGNLVWKIATANSVKYGIYAGNIVDFVGGSPRAFSASNAIQFIGPAWNLTFEDFHGDATDDPYAVTTSNAGFTAYDMTDTDATKNTDGPVYGIKVKNIRPNRMAGRGILIAASSDGDVHDVDIDYVGGGNVPIRNACVQFGIPAGHTGAIRGFRVGHIDAIVDSSSPAALVLVETSTGVLSLYGGRVDSVTARAASGSSGTRVHVVSVGTGSGVCELSIGVIRADIDLSGTNNIAALQVVGAGNNKITVDEIFVKTAGTATRSAYGVLSQSTAANYYQLGRISGAGFNFIGAAALTANDVFQIGDIRLNGTGSVGFAANNLFKASINSILALAGTETGHINIYGGSGTSELYVGSCRGLVPLFSSMSATILRFALGGGWVGSTGTITGDIALAGTATAASLTFDGTAHLHATVSQHCPGALFYNSNAAWGAGVGSYVRGDTAWTRVAA